MPNDKKIEYSLSLKDLFSKGMKTAQDSTAKLDKQMSSMSGSSGMMGAITKGNLLAGAIGQIGGAVKDFAVDSVKSYMKMEMYEARMTTLLHDRKAAMTSISNIVQDAAKTPFDLQSLIQANSMLIGSGESAMEARKATMDLGNAIAATGGGSDELNRMAVNMAQIRSIGKASAMDVKQFMFANIPIYEMLSKSMHKNVNEIKNMDISYKDLTKALAEARKEGGMFYQGLENANKTLTGQVSNLGDSWDQLKTSIGRSQSGILKDTISWANEMVSAMNASFKRQEFIQGSIKNNGGRNLSYSGGSVQTQENLNALSDVVSRSVGRAGDGGDAVKESKYLINLMKVKREQYGLAAKKDSGNFRYEADKFKNEMAVLQEGLHNIRDGSKANAMKAGAGAGTENTNAEKIKKGGSSLGSSTDVYGARPQNLTINITKLVESLNLNTTNMHESSAMIKEKVSKALMEAVNDINMMVK